MLRLIPNVWVRRARAAGSGRRSPEAAVVRHGAGRRRLDRFHFGGGEAACAGVDRRNTGVSIQSCESIQTVPPLSRGVFLPIPGHMRGDSITSQNEWFVRWTIHQNVHILLHFVRNVNPLT